MTEPTRVAILGATGTIGFHLTLTGLALGHQLTCCVRRRDRLAERFGGRIPKEIRVVVGDILDEDALSKALDGQSAAVNAAGNPRQGATFLRICQTIVTQAERRLAAHRRLWLFGGVAALDFPRTGLMGTDLPLVPAMFEAHKENYQLLRQSDLDWSFICPGHMVAADDRNDSQSYRITVEEMPFQLPPWVTHLPKIALAYIFSRHLADLTVPLETVARLVMSNLSSGGPYSNKRVGISQTTRPK